MPIHYFCSNPDASTIAVMGEDQVVHLVPLEPGKQVRSLPGLYASLYAASFSLDGRRFAVYGLNCMIRVFDTQTGTLDADLAAFKAGGGSWGGSAILKFSRDGERILAFGDSPKATLWSVTKKARLADLGKDDEGRVTLADWSADSSLVATATSDRVLRIWDGVTGEPKLGPMGIGPEITSIALDPKGSRIAVGCVDSAARLVDLVKGTLEFTLSHQDQNMFGDLEVGCVRFSRDGEHLLTTSFPFHEVRSWNPRDGKEEWRTDFGGGNEGGIRAEFMPDGTTVFVSRGARIIDARSGATKWRVSDDCIRFYSLSPNGNRVLGIENGSLISRDAATLEVQCTITLAMKDRVSIPSVSVMNESNR
jgi:WD40 repeat protein